MLTPDQIERKLESIDRKLNQILFSKREKNIWVKVGYVKSLTGWNDNELRNARKNGLVKQRKIGKEISYLLNSIDPVFIKATA